jgi:hypothetical protein
MKLIDSPIVPLISAKNFSGRIMLRLLNETRKFFRQRIRKQVMKLLPVYEITDKQQPPIHLLVCRRDYEMAAISAMVLNHLGKKGHVFILHDDGSLDNHIESLFHKYLPGSTFIRRPDADTMAVEKLSAQPNLLRLRAENILISKLTDIVLWAKNERIGYLDSDVLFFKYPFEYIQSLQTSSKTNFFNRDIADAYVANRYTLANACSINLPACINSGLWVMNKNDFDFNLIESWLKHPFLKRHLTDYRLEQTLFAMLAGVSDAGYFPKDYDVNFEKKPDTSICKHYVGRIRYGYELEGLNYLINKQII